MKRITPILIVVVMILAAVPVQAAGVLSENICYWCRMGDGSIDTVINPDSAKWTWLQQNWSNVLLKVQQTVYDPETTVTLLGTSGYTAPQGSYLFSYSVSNISWLDSIDTGGLKSLVVDWGFAPVMVMESKWQTPVYWTAGSSEIGPVWTWVPPAEEPSAPGLLPGSTVGGLWALANTGQTCVADCSARTGEETGGITVFGKTIAPVPEPAGMLALVVGCVGLVVRRRGR